jgi:hypothetical protein
MQDPARTANRKGNHLYRLRVTENVERVVKESELGLRLDPSMNEATAN